jgi:hypothetical protein
MEDYHKKIMENILKKMKTTSKKTNIFLIHLNFRGKPFLGLAQLSKIVLFNSYLETCLLTKVTNRMSQNRK